MQTSSDSYCSDRSHLAGRGPVAEVESQITEFYDVKHALAVSNATLGLLALSEVLGLRGAQIVGPNLTWGGSFAPFMFMGAQLRFAEVLPECLTISPSSAKQALTPDTRAILSVDYLGIPANGPKLRKIADDKSVWWISDAASSLGATRAGQPANADADAWVVSFGHGKPITASGGGAILTNRSDIYEKLVWLTQHPDRHRTELRRISQGAVVEVENEFSLNVTMHPQAALLIASTFQEQLSTLCQRQRNGTQLRNLLRETGLVSPLPIGISDVVPTYPSLIARWNGRQRPAQLAHELSLEGIEVQLSPFPGRFVPLQPAFLAQHREPGHRPSIDLSRYVSIKWNESDLQ